MTLSSKVPVSVYVTGKKSESQQRACGWTLRLRGEFIHTSMKWLVSLFSR